MSDDNNSELGVISTLLESFEIFKKMFPTFLLAYLVFLLSLGLLSGFAGEGDTQSLSSSVTILIILFALSAVLSGTLTAATWSYMNGQQNPIRAGVTRCLEVITSVVGASFLSALFVFGGLILLVVPGIIAAMTLIVVMPVVIIENPGIVDSLKRSYALTDGHRMQIFMLILVLVIPTIFSIKIGGLVGIEIGQFIGQVLQGLITIFNTIMYVVIYKRLINISAH